MSHARAKIVIEHLSVQYADGTESLRDISLEILANQITVLFGPAGGGKSTLLRTLNRLNDLVDGVHLAGDCGDVLAYGRHGHLLRAIGRRDCDLSQ